MQQPLSPIPQTDCLLMELTAASASEGNLQQIDLYVTLHFDEACQALMTGYVKYALRGGRLKLKLENATFVGPSCQESPQTQRLISKKDSAAKEVCQVSFVESETQPTWEFSLPKQTNQSKLENFKLATIELQAFPAKIQTFFQISPGCLRVTGAEGLWHFDISPNKHAILETKLALWLQENQQIGGGWVGVLNYQSPEMSERSGYEISENPFRETANLSQAIEEVLGAKTENFRELAKLAGLNYMVDFAGANLLGVSLEGSDLSNANLEGINLRGALLSDVDFSGANLSGANLAGADISGALLSDANLQNADLHRASLALANLGGANLAGANLKEANLSNANLSDADLSNANLSDAELKDAGLMLTKLAGVNLAGANIEGARFRHDSGITEEMQKDLIERGAIFEV
ncbi:pentapeptide repeat-containing protein [Ancylothrix sp. C2]|uniref:pentapeptide repeat-containing protein n=1 Tax=Ancylothrix sp. D3o TaxID=2953691 RepID=UPI0021BB4F0B|nr:pentapeptide repeat-containing protein [Ancylothrix sp. D3o]MCT7951146.1 pentapeptide repeat-containing protein [Ancylothrix sp. D3o]